MMASSPLYQDQPGLSFFPIGLSITLFLKNEYTNSRGSKFEFWKIVFEAHDEFPSYLIQSKTSTSTYEFSESNRAKKFAILLSNFSDENRELNQLLQRGCRHQVALVPPGCNWVRANFMINERKVTEGRTTTTD